MSIITVLSHTAFSTRASSRRVCPVPHCPKTILPIATGSAVGPGREGGGAGQGVLRGWARRIEAPDREGGQAGWEGRMTGTIYIQFHNALSRRRRGGWRGRTVPRQFGP